MDTLRRPLAVILALTAVAVLINFVFSPFYEDVLKSETVWTVLDWFMAFCVIVALITTYAAKRTAETEDGDTNSYICVNVAFYAAAGLAVLFFWNWINELVVGAGNEGEIHLIFWAVIDTLFIILIARMSIHLWKGSPGE